jgi:hypothetical protein
MREMRTQLMAEKPVIELFVKVKLQDKEFQMTVDEAKGKQ